LLPRRVTATGDGFMIDLPAEASANATRLAGTPQEIFPLVAQVYDELKIPIETLETRTFLLGNTSFRAHRRVAGIPMTRIVDCGHTVAGLRAGSDMITFNLLTRVKADGPRNVVVETTITAIARSTEGASSNPMNCTSLGELERRIAEGVRDLSGG
jgi:hypothetical protein